MYVICVLQRQVGSLTYISMKKDPTTWKDKVRRYELRIERDANRINIRVGSITVSKQVAYDKAHNAVNMDNTWYGTIGEGAVAGDHHVRKRDHHFLTSPVEISSKIWEDTSFWDSDYCVGPCGNRNRCMYGFT